jgi:hypothetical protein
MTPQQRADAGPGVKILGRWHDFASRSGVIVMESSDIAAVQRYVGRWNPYVDIELCPVLDDEEAAVEQSRAWLTTAPLDVAPRRTVKACPHVGLLRVIPPTTTTLSAFAPTTALLVAPPIAAGLAPVDFTCWSQRLEAQRSMMKRLGGTTGCQSRPPAAASFPGWIGEATG